MSFHVDKHVQGTRMGALISLRVSATRPASDTNSSFSSLARNNSIEVTPFDAIDRPHICSGFSQKCIGTTSRLTKGNVSLGLATNQEFRALLFEFVFFNVSLNLILKAYG